MGVKVADGTVLSIASAYGTSKTMSALSNATEAVATLEASHGVVVSDIIELTSGWGGIDGMIVRAKTVVTNDVTLEGLNTSDTTLYPAAGGTGTVREISTWQQMQQVLEVDSEGGAQQFATYQFLDQLFQRRIPTVQDPVNINLQLADDVSLAMYATIKTAMASRAPIACRWSFRGGAKLYHNAYISMGVMPGMRLGEPVRRSVTLAVIALPSEYTS